MQEPIAKARELDLQRGPWALGLGAHSWYFPASLPCCLCLVAVGFSGFTNFRSEMGLRIPSSSWSLGFQGHLLQGLQSECQLVTKILRRGVQTVLVPLAPFHSLNTDKVLAVFCHSGLGRDRQL